MLVRMTERNEIRKQTFDISIPDFFMLKSTVKLKSYNKYKHEKGGGDLFVAMIPYLTAWKYEPLIGKDRGDRGMRIDDKTIYFEVDKCTEGPGIIDLKLENYMRHADRTGERFYVVFALIGTDEEVALRGENLTRLFASKKRENQFLAANLNNLVRHPFGEVLNSPKDGRLSFNDLE